jgi:hypothetical protein
MSDEAGKWMESTALEWCARYGTAGASRQNLADGDYWLSAPMSVQKLSQREKGLLLDRTIRRLIRRGRLSVRKNKEQRKRAHGEVSRRYRCTVNRYVRVNILMALALAAAEPHELKRP